jgi:hypothetical protein
VRGRVVAFAAICVLLAAGIFWLALGGRDPEPAGDATRAPAVTARQVDRAPDIGAERSAPPPEEAEPADEIALDDGPVIEVLDILEALNERPEEEE